MAAAASSSDATTATSAAAAEAPTATTTPTTEEGGAWRVVAALTVLRDSDDVAPLLAWMQDAAGWDGGRTVVAEVMPADSETAAAWEAASPVAKHPLVQVGGGWRGVATSIGERLGAVILPHVAVFDGAGTPVLTDALPSLRAAEMRRATFPAGWPRNVFRVVGATGAAADPDGDAAAWLHPDALLRARLYAGDPVNVRRLPRPAGSDLSPAPAPRQPSLALYVNPPVDDDDEDDGSDDDGSDEEGGEGPRSGGAAARGGRHPAASDVVVLSAPVMADLGVVPGDLVALAQLHDVPEAGEVVLQCVGAPSAPPALLQRAVCRHFGVTPPAAASGAGGGGGGSSGGVGGVGSGGGGGACGGGHRHQCGGGGAHPGAGCPPGVPLPARGGGPVGAHAAADRRRARHGCGAHDAAPLHRHRGPRCCRRVHTAASRRCGGVVVASAACVLNRATLNLFACMGALWIRCQRYAMPHIARCCGAGDATSNAHV